ncbi:MAG: polysaccharide pyruvyl transferase family protein [Nostoc sp. SerVER01]|nr:polysaccharide pyruvyl transferase family protein [Nostoc sp. SerVER01]
MKQDILSLFLNAYATKLRLMRIFNHAHNQQNRSILILPPSNFGSIGDEAMITGIIDYFKDKGVEKIGLISCSLSPDWNNFKTESQNLKIVHHIFSDSWKQWFEFTKLASTYDQFYCLGADVMDGKYSEYRSARRIQCAALAKQTGTDSAILGFSFNEEPTEKVVEAFQKLPLDIKLYARDPISQNRLIQKLKRPIELVADLAFLVHPASNDGHVSDVLKWIKDQKINQRVVLGINANSQIISQPDEQDINKIIHIYVEALTEIYSQNDNVSFILVPHDFRHPDKKSSDIGLSEAIWQDLPAEVQYHCLKLPAQFSARQIKSIAGNLDMVLSGRMHFAIACLGQGTPVACITYQGKFEGLFRHFELEGMLIKPEEALEESNLGKLIIALLEKRDHIRKNIQNKLSKVQQLAQANLYDQV